MPRKVPNPTPSQKYTGPTVNASDLTDGSDFHDEQAYIDAAYIALHSDVADLVLGVKGSLTAEQKQVLNGPFQSGTFGADLGIATTLDFAANPPSSDVVDAVTAAKQFKAGRTPRVSDNGPTDPHVVAKAKKRQ